MDSNKTSEKLVFSYTQQVLDNYPYAAVLLNIIKNHDHPTGFEILHTNSKYDNLIEHLQVFTIGNNFTSSNLANENQLKFQDFLFDNTQNQLIDIQQNGKKLCYQKFIVDTNTIQLNLILQEALFPFQELLALKRQVYYTVDYQQDKLSNWQIIGEFETIIGYTNQEVESLPSGWFSLLSDQEFQKLLNDHQSNESNNNDLELSTKSGINIWCNHLFKCEKDKNGNVKIIGSLTNIDERKRNDLYLNNLKTAFEQTSSSIVITDKKGSIQYVNKKFTDTTGYTSSEVLGKNPRILKTGNTNKQQYQMLWDIIKSGKTWRGQFLNRKKNGEKYWEKAVIAPVFDDKHEIINFVAIKEDITNYKLIEKDREKIEKALKVNEEKFRSLFNLATDPIFISDLNGNILQINDLACNLLNIECKNITKIKLQDYFDTAEINQLLQTLNCDKKSKVLQELALQKDNHELILEFNASIMQIGEKSFILIIARDITERKIAERAMLQSETKFRLLVENVNAVFWMLDLESQAILYISPNFSKVYEYSVDELINGNIKNYLSVVHPEDIDFVTRTFRKGLKEDIDQLEFRILKNNGEIQWMQYKSYVIKTPEGKPVQVGFCEDVTERMMISEKMQQQNFELNKINKELDQFVYRVSHNLRAPLTSILGIVNLLKAIKSEADKSQYIKLIETSILKLDETIHEIIDYSKNSRIEIQSELIDIESLVQETLDSLKFMNEKDSVVVEIENQVEESIYSDANRIKVLLNNLISNAFKYIDDSKKKSLVQIKLTLINDQLSIVVRDNGIGIRKDDTEKIFNMFYRGTDKSFGAGLGLAIVKEVVDKMQGTIQLSSVIYEYTEFNITLPVNLH